MYYIYHIEGVKIGCTNNLKRRIKQQGYINYEVLESYDDIEIASERERVLSIQYGYGWNSSQHYKKITNAATKEQKRQGGVVNVLSGHIHKLGKELGNKRKLSGEWDVIRMKGTKIGTKLLSKPVIVLDKNGNKVARYDSVSEAGRKLGIKPPNITVVLKGRQKTAKGYMFQYEKG
jgi:hypothetical protein